MGDALKRCLFLLALILAGTVASCSKNKQVQSTVTVGEMSEAAHSAEVLVEPGNYNLTVFVDGIERQYVVHVPPEYVPGKAMAVVLAFHGGGGNAEKQMSLSGLNATSDVHGFLVVYPEGTAAPVSFVTELRTWNAGSCCGKAKRENLDDVRFAAAIIDDLDTMASIDKRRIFATGMSNGAMMAYRLACELSDQIAAIAPVAGTIGIDNCTPSRPVSVLHFHGTADEYAPFEGGFGKLRSAGEFKSVQDTMEMFADLNECQEPPTMTYQEGDATCLTYLSCKNNATVALCSIKDGGHTWPGGRPFPIGGKTSRDISASEAMWRFFEAHPMP